MPFGSRNEEALELAPVLGPRLSPIDGFLRDWRVRKAEPFIGPGVSVLDVGCYDGSLFKAYASRMARGVGIDPTLTRSTGIGRFRFIADRFPSDLIGDERFDVITMLAVLEHVDLSELPTWRAACERLLVPGGTLLLTVPAPQVDKILDVLRALHLVAGMSAEEHHGFDPSLVPQLFDSRRFRMVIHRRFEMGLNHLFVFRRGATGEARNGDVD